ncbi:hypothetical protein C8R44DRAFT_749368 [Mycena epipterygia]|nr:hypothetical protein C8R44DRAFT_749368 [Mycena epipterygia]
MKFSIATILASAIFSSSGALAAMTLDDLHTNIIQLTAESQRILDALTPLSPSSGSLVITIGVNVAQGFQTIITTISTDMTAMQATPPFVGVICTPIVNALVTFVEVHQALLSTVIGKHSIFAQFGATAPIAAILRTLEGAIDALAFGLIDLIPCASDTVKMGQGMLDASVTNSINLYGQLCIPSPLYPVLQPICVSL